MESLYKGFLTKSPPEHKTQGPLKILNSKWRKRYFVLWVPPQHTQLHDGSCQAALDYYTNDKMGQKKGSINLKQCKSISYSESIKPFAFTIQTVDRDNARSRNYCLVAENIVELTQWMHKLESVIGIQNSKADLSLKKVVKSASSSKTFNIGSLNPQDPTSDEYLPLANCSSGIAIESPKESDLCKTDILNKPSSPVILKEPLASVDSEKQNNNTNIDSYNINRTKLVNVPSIHKPFPLKVNLLSNYNDEPYEEIYKKPVNLTSNKDYSVPKTNFTQDSLYNIPRSNISPMKNEEKLNKSSNLHFVNSPVDITIDSVFHNSREYYNMNDKPPPIPQKVSQSPKDFNFTNLTYSAGKLNDNNIYISHANNIPIANYKKSFNETLSYNSNQVPLPVKICTSSSENSSSDDDDNNANEEDSCIVYNKNSQINNKNVQSYKNKNDLSKSEQFISGKSSHSSSHITPSFSTKAIYLHNNLPINNVMSIASNNAPDSEINGRLNGSYTQNIKSNHVGQNVLHDLVPGVNNMNNHSPRLSNILPYKRPQSSENGVDSKSSNLAQPNNCETISWTNTAKQSPHMHHGVRSMNNRHSPGAQQKISGKSISSNCLQNEGNDNQFNALEYSDIDFMEESQSRSSTDIPPPNDKIEYDEIDHDKTRFLSATRQEISKKRHL